MDARSLINSAKRRKLSAEGGVSAPPVTPAPAVKPAVPPAASAPPPSKMIKLSSKSNSTGQKTNLISNTTAKTENPSKTAPTLPLNAPTKTINNDSNTHNTNNNNTHSSNNTNQYISITSANMDTLLNKSAPQVAPAPPKKMIKLSAKSTQSNPTTIAKNTKPPNPPVPSPKLSTAPAAPSAKLPVATSLSTPNPKLTPTSKAQKVQPPQTSLTNNDNKNPEANSHNTSTSITSKSVGQLLNKPTISSSTHAPINNPSADTTPLSDLTYITSSNMGALLQASIPPPPPPAPPKKIIKLTASATKPANHSPGPVATKSPTVLTSRKRSLSASASSTLSPASAKLQKIIKLKATSPPSSSSPTTAPTRKLIKLSSSAPLPARAPTTPSLVQKTVKISSLSKMPSSSSSSSTTTSTTFTSTSTATHTITSTSDSTITSNFTSQQTKARSVIMFPGLDDDPSATGAEDFLSTLSALLPPQ